MRFKKKCNSFQIAIDIGPAIFCSFMRLFKILVKHWVGVGCVIGAVIDLGLASDITHE